MNSSPTPPWDQRLARIAVKPLAATPITPNQITVFTLLLAWSGAIALAHGGANWGAGAFALARFFDHFDGELARLTGRTSKTGYYLDYATGGLSYAALFIGLGIGLQHSVLGSWALVLGAAGALSALLAMPLNVGIDKVTDNDDAVGYPTFAGFELEDGIYLLVPITWMGALVPFFALAGIGAIIYLFWTLSCFLSHRSSR